MMMNSSDVESKKQRLYDYAVSFAPSSPVRFMNVPSTDMKGVYVYLETIFTPAFLAEYLISIELQLPF